MHTFPVNLSILSESIIAECQSFSWVTATATHLHDALTVGPSIVAPQLFAPQLFVSLLGRIIAAPQLLASLLGIDWRLEGNPIPRTPCRPKRRMFEKISIRIFGMKPCQFRTLHSFVFFFATTTTHPSNHRRCSPTADCHAGTSVLSM